MASTTSEKGTGRPNAGLQAPIGTGFTVTLATPDGAGKAIKLTMVEREDSDPTKGRISIEASMARAVAGRREGEEVVVPS